jgi:hypothetical protein
LVRNVVSSSICVPKVAWPVTVSCEMHIDEWKYALDKAGLLPEMLHIIEGFTIVLIKGSLIIKLVMRGGSHPIITLPRSMQKTKYKSL